MTPDPFRDLDLDTRLRWIIRDIRTGRAKFMVPTGDDVALLEQLGMITVNNGELAVNGGSKLGEMIFQ